MCPRRYSYICKTCKRKMDLRRFYRNRISHFHTRIDELQRKLAKIIKEIGPGRKG